LGQSTEHGTHRQSGHAHDLIDTFRALHERVAHSLRIFIKVHGRRHAGIPLEDPHDVLTVRLVGDLDYKVDGAYHRNLRMILVPSGNRTMLERSTIVPHAIADEIVRYVPDLDQAAGLVFGDLEFL